jgi:hypothetical protein
MRVAIDIRKVNEFGVGTYIWNLVRNLAALDAKNDYLLLGSNRNFHELGPLPPNFKHLYQPDGDTFWRNHCAIPMCLRKNHLDVVHIPHHEAPVMVRRPVVTVHDCVHLLFPQDALKVSKLQDLSENQEVVKSARHIVAVSESTKDDLINIFKLPQSKISVVITRWRTNARRAASGSRALSIEGSVRSVLRKDSSAQECASLD